MAKPGFAAAGISSLRTWKGLIYSDANTPYNASMGLRFRRSIKLLPGVRLNLSKSGIGVSAGASGLRVGVDSKGRGYTSAGIPGTGLSTRQFVGQSTPPDATVGHANSIGTLGIVIFIILGIAIVGALLLVVYSTPVY